MALGTGLKEVLKYIRLNAKHCKGNFMFHCDCCSHEERICIGTGFGFRAVYDEVVNDIRAGKYGDKWKNLYLSNPDTVVDAEFRLYVCPDCGAWKRDYNLGLYKLKENLTDQELKAAGQNGYGMEMEWVYLYSIRWPIRYYRKIADCVHRCPACGKRMHLGGYEDKPVCPKCGGKGRFLPGLFSWD